MSTMAFAGQPLKEVAAQAGQYIKYQCGKGECGTCEVCVFPARHCTLWATRFARRPVARLLSHSFVRCCRQVRVDGNWIRTCSVKVPPVASGEEYKVHVRGSMVKPKKSSKFFSFTSYIAGARNNILGMVGFVREGRKSRERFRERIEAEEELKRRIAERKAQKKAMSSQ